MLDILQKYSESVALETISPIAFSITDSGLLLNGKTYSFFELINKLQLNHLRIQYENN